MKNDFNESFEETVFDEGFFMTQFLKISAKSDWEKLNSKGRGYLHYLAALGFHEIIKIIAENVRNPSIKDLNSKTPIHIALSKHYYECAYEITRIVDLNEGNFKGEESLNDRIQKIQSHVRAWLQQNQFRNIKRAAKTLQKTFRGMVVRKNFKYQKQAAIIIQKSVRKWLLSAYHEKN